MRTLVGRPAISKLFVLLLSVWLAFQPAAFGQEYPRSAFAPQELQQLLAPIALYPDSLLSQILMASTYPIEVFEAARWSYEHPGLRGEAAVRAVVGRGWDPSVKSLVAFPQILSTMNQNPGWTERLGDAFLMQEPDVMDTIQVLRQRAYAAGNLNSDERLSVESRDGYIAIEPATEQVMYVPYYDPFAVYGAWWWPSYPPVYWAPWPGYYVRHGYAGLQWDAGIGISRGFFFGAFAWSQRHARVVNVNNYYYNSRMIRPAPNGVPGAWRHDAAHRRGAPYREVEQHQRFPGPAAVDRRAPQAPVDRRRDAGVFDSGSSIPRGPDRGPEIRGGRPEFDPNAGRVDRGRPPTPPSPRISGEQPPRAPATLPPAAASVPAPAPVRAMTPTPVTPPAPPPQAAPAQRPPRDGHGAPGDGKAQEKK